MNYNSLYFQYVLEEYYFFYYLRHVLYSQIIKNVFFVYEIIVLSTQQYNNNFQRNSIFINIIKIFIQIKILFLFQIQYLLIERKNFMKKKSLLIITDSSIKSDDIKKYLKKYELLEIMNTKNGEDELLNYITHNWVDEVLFMNVKINKNFYNKLLYMGLTIYINSLNNRNSVLHFSFIKILCKRVIDICGAIIGLVLTGLLIPIVAISIYKESPGSIFFLQDRVGKNGRIFKCYKFRTMYLDAEKEKLRLMNQNEMDNSLMFKLKEDPRIIGGKNSFFTFFRKHSLDEFPQFFNVLIGDMSLVGSRPPSIDEFKQYNHHHKIRLAIKPGLTGLWQISGRSNITKFEEVLKLDKKYIENFSLLNDIKILLKTVVVIFEGKGAF